MRIIFMIEIEIELIIEIVRFVFNSQHFLGEHVHVGLLKKAQV